MKTSKARQSTVQWLSFWLVLGWFALPAFSRGAELPSEQVRRIEAEISERMKRHHIPGLSISIVKDGKQIYSRGFGFRDIGSKKPMTPDTLFGIGSISKSFAATAILQLEESGRLTVRDPLSRFIPDLATPSFSGISVHNVLTHTTGFPELFGQIGLMASITEQNPDLTPIQDNWSSLIAFIRSAESDRLRRPGEEYLYNNEFYSLLDPVIKRASGKDYAEFLQDSLFTPLRMQRSTFSLEHLLKDHDFATGYAEVNRELMSLPFPYTTINYAAGGLFSSVTELSHFMIALLDGGVFEGKRILRESSIQEMWTPHVKVDIGGGPQAGSDYGYGWHVATDALGNLMVEHTGDYLVTGGHLTLIPGKRMGIALGMNRTVNSYAKAIVDAVIAVLEENEIVSNYNGLIGHYETRGGTIKVDIVKTGASLTMNAHFPAILGGESSVPLTPKDLAQDLFRFNVGRWDMDLRFMRLKNEPAKRLLFDRFMLIRSDR